MRILGLTAAFLTASPAIAEEDTTFSLDGHYRVRAHTFGNLFSDHAGGSYTAQQLRPQPT